MYAFELANVVEQVYALQSDDPCFPALTELPSISSIQLYEGTKAIEATQEVLFEKRHQVLTIKKKKK